MILGAPRRRGRGNRVGGVLCDFSVAPLPQIAKPRSLGPQLLPLFPCPRLQLPLTPLQSQFTLCLRFTNWQLKMGSIQPGDHKAYMQLALEQAKKSPPKPTNYRVGAVVVDSSSTDDPRHGLHSRATRKPHAEQCCLLKLAGKHGVSEEDLKEVLPKDLVLYTTVEPCSKRLSGNMPCVERVKRLAGPIKTVYVGILEPETFVAENTGGGQVCRRLEFWLLLSRVSRRKFWRSLPPVTSRHDRRQGHVG